MPTKTMTWLIARSWKFRPNAPFIELLKPRSMLHWQTLSLLHYFAARSSGAVLEIGPYMGGSTAALAQGMAKAGNGNPIITIEVGGAQNHPTMPSKDILGDLRQTLDEYGFIDRVHIVEGWSNHASTVEQVKKRLGGQKIGMWVVDGDGRVADNFELYRPMLADGAIIALDDYFCIGDPDIKQGPVQTFVHEMIKSGVMRDFGVHPWGTWFGRYLG